MTVENYKKNYFALLGCLYQKGVRDKKLGGLGHIGEADEALLGKKPTYGHGKISKIFKI